MKVRHNVTTSPQANNRPFAAGATVIGVLALIVLGALSRGTYVTWRSNQELRSETARLQRQIQSDEDRQQQLQNYFKTPDAQQILGRAEFLNSLISERSFPWTKIFMDLEKTLPPGVRVVSIAPKLVDGRAQVVMEVGAASDESKIQFLQAMEKSPSFSDVSVSEEHASNQPGEQGIVLSLTFEYATT